MDPDNYQVKTMMSILQKVPTMVTLLIRRLNLSNNYGASGWPKIASDGNIYISWVDSTPGKFDVLITKSSDGGVHLKILQM